MSGIEPELRPDRLKPPRAHHSHYIPICSTLCYDGIARMVGPAIPRKGGAAMAHDEIVRAIEEAKQKITEIDSGKVSSSEMAKIIDILDDIKSQSLRGIL